jgi:drug/metabolite transporter (DMT)-like permease
MAALSARSVAIVQVLLSGLAFGTLGVFGKLAFAAGLTPGEFLAFRFLIASTVMLVAVALLRPREFSRLGWDGLAACAALGVMGYAVFSSCYFMALERISASLTVLLLYTYPVLVSLGSWLFFKERLTRTTLAALVVVSLGLALLVGGDPQVRDTSGILFGCGSALVYTLYILGSARWLRDKPALAATALIQASAGCALSLLHLYPGDRVPMLLAHAWPVVLATALVATVLAMTLFIVGLQRLSSTEVSILSTMEPMSAVFFAAIFLQERLSAVQTIGGLLVLAALIVSSRKSRPETRHPN